jgi:hypothetical protein
VIRQCFVGRVCEFRVKVLCAGPTSDHVSHKCVIVIPSCPVELQEPCYARKTSSNDDVRIN